MSNHSIFLYDPNAQDFDASSCNLLISITGNSLSYAVTGPDATVKLLFDAQQVSDIKEVLNEQLAQQPALSAQYHQVKIACATENELLIPAALFSPDDKDWVKQYFTGDLKGNIYSNQQTLGFYPVFEVESLTDNLLNNAFAGSNVKFHAVAPLLQLVNQDGLYINFSAQTACFLYIHDDKVVFQNTFDFEDTAEFNYFLLVVLETLKIESPASAFLMGLINEGDEKYQVLQKYFGQIEFVLPKRFNNEDEVLNNLPLHYFSSLLALNLCE